MKNRGWKQKHETSGWIGLKTSVFAVLFCALIASVWTFAQEAPKKPRVSLEQKERIELMKSRGPEASLTILPMRLAGKPTWRVIKLKAALGAAFSFS